TPFVIAHRAGYRGAVLSRICVGWCHRSGREPVVVIYHNCSRNYGRAHGEGLPSSVTAEPCYQGLGSYWDQPARQESGASPSAAGWSLIGDLAVGTPLALPGVAAHCSGGTCLGPPAAPCR